MADAPSSPMTSAMTVLKQLKELWTKQPKGRRTLAVLILVGVIGFVAVTSLIHKTETWSTVAEGMSPGNSQTLYTSLISRGINARIKDNKVEVIDDDLAQARAIATISGAMTSTKTFDDLFEGQNIGRSSFDEQIAFKRALQGELSRSVMSLAQVESANVQIAFGKTSAIKELDTAPTASVTLVTRPGQQITAEQVRGIRALIAASVDRMKPDAVSVIGPRGPFDSADETSTNHQEDLETKVSNSTRALLETIVGVGHVKVVVNADVDTSKVKSTEDNYDKDSAAIRSESRTLHGSDPSTNGTQSSVGGIAGARGNLPGAPAPTTGAGSGAPAPGNGDLQETKNYEISHKVVETIKPEQTIKKLHVAIVVDEPKDKAGKSLPHSKDDLDRMMALARNTAGIDDARGDTIELRSVAFAPVTEPEVPVAPKPLLPVPLPVAAAAAGGLLVFLVVVVLLLKSRKGKKANKTKALVLQGGKLPFPTPVHEFERQVIEAELDPASKAAANTLDKREAPGLAPGRTAQERVMDAVRADVDRAAGVLTAWLAESPPAAKGATK
ncbi:N/A [soil metagenome]